MDGWAKVVTILKQELLPYVNRSGSVSEWLDGLNATPDDQRLAISLAVDLKNGAYSEETKLLIAEILDLLDHSAVDRSAEFGLKLEGHPKRQDLYCTSRFIGPDSADLYVCVMSLARFITCAGSAFGFTDNVEDKNRLRKRFGAEFRARALAGYGTWWGGENRIVWVTCARRFIENWGEMDPAKRASAIKDALGIATKPHIFVAYPVEYVGVEYPSEFGRPTHQPTALDAWWQDSGQWYLSYGKLDSWGRTRSISGTHEPQVERVHRAFQFEQVGSNYSIWYLGTAVESVQDQKALLRAAYNLVANLDAMAAGY